jgi:hypothetical protein
MKNNLLIFTFSFLAFPALGWAQSAPDFKELLDSAMVRDSNLKMQITQNKLTDLDEHKLKDIFLPTLELSGKPGILTEPQDLRHRKLISLLLSIFLKALSIITSMYPDFRGSQRRMPKCSCIPEVR